MTVNVQAFIDAADLFDIAVEEGRLLHFNGGQAHIQMFPNRDTILSIDFTAQSEPRITAWLSPQYVADNKPSCAHYKERYKDWSHKEHLYNHYQMFPPEVVA